MALFLGRGMMNRNFQCCLSNSFSRKNNSANFFKTKISLETGVGAGQERGFSAGWGFGGLVGKTFYGYYFFDHLFC